MAKKKCKYCKKTFSVRPQWASERKYCSRKCMYRDREERAWGFDICDQCDKEYFYKKRNRGRKYNYCSLRCYKKLLYKETHMEVACTQCKGEFDIRKKEFNKNNSKVFFCTPGCMKKYYSEVTRKCLYCKKKFVIKPHFVRGGGGKYCSQNCYHKHKIKKYKKKNKKKKILCAWCDKIIWRYPSQINTGRGKFCSHQCADASRSEKHRVLRVCAFCTRPFTVIKSILPFSSHIYCSQKCSGEALKKRVVLKCATCETDFEVAEGRSEIAKYCSRICADIGEQPRRESLGFGRKVYTPELLKHLLEWKENTCGFPLCLEPRTPLAGNFACCKYHWLRLRVALYLQRRTREKIFRKAGLDSSAGLNP